MAAYRRRRFIPDMSVSADVNQANRLSHETWEDHWERVHNNYERVTGKGKTNTTFTTGVNPQPRPVTPKPVRQPLTPEQIERNIKRAIRLVKMAAIGAGAFFAVGLVGLTVQALKQSYDDAVVWVHKKIDPNWVKEEVAPKPATDKNKTDKQSGVTPVEPARTNPPVVSVYKPVAETSYNFAPSDLFKNDIYNILEVVLTDSGVRMTANMKNSMQRAAGNSVTSFRQPFEMASFERSTGDSVEIMMTTANRSTLVSNSVICVGSSQGIRSLTHATFVVPKTGSASVTFSNSVRGANNQTINLATIAKRNGECGQAMSDLKNIDPAIPSAMH